MTFDPRLPDDTVNVSRTHPVREAVVLVAGVAACVGIVFVLLAAAIDTVIRWVPPSFEATLFANDWFTSETAATAADDPQVAEVGALLDRLAAHWPDNPYAFRVVVMDESAPNAVALPGGWIGVTEGLLEAVASENELAFVLAHEIGHFHNRDHLRGIGRGVAFAVVLGSLGLADGTATRLATISGDLTARAFDRRQESDADRFALAIVAAEYGHVAGALDFFQRLPHSRGGAAEGIHHYFSTHPLSAERTDSMREVAREAGWPEQGPLREWTARAPTQ